MIKESIHHIISTDWTQIGLLGMAFSLEIKNIIRSRQDNVCDCCGEKRRKLQVHHRVQQCQNGSDNIENGVGVCQDCHRDLDKEASRGVIYPQTHTATKYYPQGNGL